ncbi:hypothetical protein [Niallia alba]|nr:hypothetical protein [Niallia alba]
MESVKIDTTIKNPNELTEKHTKASLYKSVWRWHFYAGIFLHR